MNKFKVMVAALLLVTACSVYAEAEVVGQSTRRIEGKNIIIDDLINFTRSNDTNVTPDTKAEMIRIKQLQPLAVKRVATYNGNELVKEELFDKDGNQVGYRLAEEQILP